MQPQPQCSLDPQNLQDQLGRRGHSPKETDNKQVKQVTEEVETDLMVLWKDFYLPVVGKESKRGCYLIRRRCRRRRRRSIVRKLPINIMVAQIFIPTITFPSSTSAWLSFPWPWEIGCWEIFPPSRDLLWICLCLLFSCTKILNFHRLKFLLCLPELLSWTTLVTLASPPSPKPRGPTPEIMAARSVFLALSFHCCGILWHGKANPWAHPPQCSAHNSCHAVAVNLLDLN